MEQLIIFIVLAILGSLFNGKGKKKEAEKGQAKPFVAQQKQQNDPVKKLKEMSKEMYRELQRELQDETSEPPSRQTPPISTPQRQPVPQPIQIEPIAPVSRAPMEEKSREKHRGRLSAHGGSVAPVVAIPKQELIPRNEEDMLKGIIFSEILGPPKSKR